MVLSVFLSVLNFLIYVIFLGLVWSEIKQLWDVGLQEYVGDMWNVIDFVTNALYVATVALRIVAFYQVFLCYTSSSSPKSCTFLLFLMYFYSHVFLKRENSSICYYHNLTEESTPYLFLFSISFYSYSQTTSLVFIWDKRRICVTV